MSNLPVHLSCPLGHKCEEARDGAIQRCAWLVQMRGMNPQTGEEADEHGCAMAWLPILLVENARVSRGTSAAVESFRNEMVDASRLSLESNLIAFGAAAVPRLNDRQAP